MGLWVDTVYSKVDLISIVYVVFIVLLAFYLISFRNSINYFKFIYYKKRLSKQGVIFKESVCVVKLFEREFKTRAFKDTRTVTLKIPPRKTKCNCLVSKDWVTIFCRLKYFGVFKIAIDPLLIKLNDQEDNLFLNIIKKRVVEFKNITHYNDELIILITNEHMEVEKIVIPDMKSIMK